MTEFSKEKQYIFTGYMSIIERKMEKGFELNELGYFIKFIDVYNHGDFYDCLLYTSPSPRDRTRSRMPSSA